MTDTIYKLNLLYGNFLSAQWNPLEIQFDADAVTIAKNDESPFMLKAVSGYTKTIINEIEIEGSQFVIRGVVPYSFITRIEKDPGYGFFYLALVKNEMLKQLAKYVNLNKYTVVWNRPGIIPSWFIELDHIAGFEIRAYVNRG